MEVFFFLLSLHSTNKQETMTIDIEPIIEKANEFDRICMDMREIDALYVIRLANGKDYTVKWDLKEMGTFCPKRTVSEMIQAWEESILRRHAEAVEAVKTRLHPTFTVTRFVTYPNSDVPVYPRQTITEPKTLDYYEKQHFKYVARTLAEDFGKMTFIKIV